MAEEQLDWGKVKEFAGLMLNDLGAAMQGALTYIGDRLGIFKALAAAGYTLVRFQASKLPTVAELQAALPIPASNIVAMPARGQAVSVSTRAPS